MKNILVTGTMQGLGLQITKTLLEKGYAVFGATLGLNEELESLGTKFPGKLTNIVCDLSDLDSSINRIFKDHLGYDTHLHGFVNNAAIAYDDIISNLRYEPLVKMYQINVFSPMMLTKHVIRNMLLHQVRGSIVHISSISVHTGYKGLAMYASTKGALEAFSRTTAREWGEKGIRSNALVAGFMETAMSGTLSSEQRDRIFNRTSLKKPTTTVSVANMIEFLLSDSSLSVTGANINVDSGTI
jgi:3-oxoacyl-[acyl-carrier protein] reductase